VLEAADGLGITVPQELSVVGFDDIDVASYVGLTTIRQPLVESGRRGGALLLRSLSGYPPHVQTELLPLELIVRKTTGPAPRRSRGRRGNGGSE
jgi:DNA-binding LacI/PurR family transcriptional regulator